MRRAALLVTVVVLAGAALASGAVRPLTTAKVHGPEFGTSGGDEPYLVGLEPRAGGGAVAALVTQLNLTDTPPGDFILRPLSATGATAGPGVTFTDKANLQGAAMALGAGATRGLAAWDSWEDGEGSEAGPIFVRPFGTADARPDGPTRKAAGGTQLVDLLALGDGYLLLHDPRGAGLTMQALDAAGAPQGEPTVQDDFFDPDSFGSPGDDRVLLVNYDGLVAIVGPEGFVLEPKRAQQLKNQFLVDAVQLPGGDWLLATDNDRKGSRPKLRTLSESGELGRARNVRGIGAGEGISALAYSGRRGLLIGGGKRTCDGLQGVPLNARGEAVAKPRVLTTPANCAKSGVYDVEASAAGRKRFVVGWTHSNGAAGHYVYATGAER